MSFNLIGVPRFETGAKRHQYVRTRLLVWTRLSGRSFQMAFRLGVWSEVNSLGQLFVLDLVPYPFLKT